MLDPDAYASERAAALEDDWQFSRIFAAPEARPGIIALLALRAEMQDVLAQLGEPGIGAMKFEWWRNELERGFSGNAQHPLAQSLGRQLGRAGGMPEYCIELVDAAEMEAERAALSEQDFRLYLYRSGGVLAEQFALLAGCTDRATLDAARRIGELKRFSDLVLATGAMCISGAWLFPADWLQRCGLNAHSLAAADAAALESLAQVLLEALDRERVVTRTAMEGAILPASVALHWPLAQRDHHFLQQDPQRAFLPQPAKGNPFARLWTAWRGARRARRLDF